MRTLRSLTILCAVTALFANSARAQQIQLNTVVTGLASPVFVSNAGDGLNRLFIVERAGIIKVLQPGDTTPTIFLDIVSKVASAGAEQGLLGLAFHPLYQSNGRFFVFYTRTGDGALVIAEYHAVPAASNTADSTETVLLSIPHPTNTNHNGGMLAFGPDGYLYIGVGDGGGANDPPNNAQNTNVLLGKILRINIDAVGVRYASPPDNPFFGAVDGREEIFAYGMRNPWRFSFDLLTGDQWVGDVGQAEREEVDTPIVNGGNYGWRVFEGTACTRIDRSLCSMQGNYIFPIFDYTHSGGRCSITGGYVYRGLQDAVPAGTYIYGDYCSGEIFGWNGLAQSVLLDTA
jgi:glucose/arabinose dehydrogenase